MHYAFANVQIGAVSFNDSVDSKEFNILEDSAYGDYRDITKKPLAPFSKWQRNPDYCHKDRWRSWAIAKDCARPAYKKALIQGRSLAAEMGFVNRPLTYLLDDYYNPANVQPSKIRMKRSSSTRPPAGREAGWHRCPPGNRPTRLGPRGRGLRR